MRAGLGLTLGLLLGSAPGCADSAFACQSDDACAGGRCEPQGWCSFPDGSCPSGHRFGEHAADGLAGACVEPMAATDTTATTEPNLPATSAESTTDAGADTQVTNAVSDTSSGGGAATSTTGDDDGTSTGGAPMRIGPLPIADDLDDGCMFVENAATTWLPGGEVEGGFFGEYPDGGYYVAYLRFEIPVALAAADAPTDVRLRLTAHAPTTYNWTAGHAVAIRLQASPDAPQIDDGGAAFPVELGGLGPGVTLGREVVRWPDDGGLTWDPAINESPDLSPLFAGLLADGDLAAGAHVQLWLTVATPTGLGGEVTYVDYAAGRPNAVAQLQLTFGP